MVAKYSMETFKSECGVYYILVYQNNELAIPTRYISRNPLFSAHRRQINTEIGIIFYRSSRKSLKRFVSER